jgi:hypothetical protein
MASETPALAVTSLVTAFLQWLPQPIPLLYGFPQTSEAEHCTQVSCVGQPIGDNQQILFFGKGRQTYLPWQHLTRLLSCMEIAGQSLKT